MQEKTPPVLSTTSLLAQDYDANAMPVSVARDYIQKFLQPITEQEQVPIREALNRVSAVSIVSPFDVPDFDNSAMDGYALVLQDWQASTPLRVIGTAFAGHAFSGTYQAGSCIRIMTGAVVPAWADTVVAQENVRVLDDQIDIIHPPALAANIRRAGEDIQQGAEVFAAGHCFQPADIGLLASLGIAQVTVFRKLKVAFFSTGDELIDISQARQAGKIYDSNRYTLFAMLQQLGVAITDLGAVADQPDLLEATLLQAAAHHDVVITSGGVSVGQADFMRDILSQHGQVLFWKIAMKPGKPLAYGKIQQAHYFGLPGNPVAVMVTFYQFVQQALQQLMGQSQGYVPPPLWVKLASPLKKARGRMEFQRGIVAQEPSGEWSVRTTGNQSSGVLSSMSRANCLIILDEDCQGVAAGEMVAIQLLKGLS